MTELQEELRAELSEALRRNDGQLGKVFTLLETGARTNRELVEGLAAANQGAAGNLRVTVNAVLDGVLPNGPSVALQSRRSIGGLLRDNPGLSDTARSHLEALRSALEQIASNESAVRAEEADIEAATKTLEQTAAELSGVYVYTLPTFFRTTQKVDPDRYWFKIGKTDRVAGIRLGEQGRVTGLPEDPWLLRVYRSNSRSPQELEQEFHRLLSAAGHARSSGRNTGREWFATNLEFLDTVAGALGCTVAEADLPTG